MIIRDNYLDDECVPKHFDTAQLRTVQEHLLLGSKNHVCSFEPLQTEKRDVVSFVRRLRKEVSQSFA